MQALWWYEGINGKLAQGNTAHIFERPKIIQLGKFGGGYPRLCQHFHHQAFLLYIPNAHTTREGQVLQFVTVSSGFLTIVWVLSR